MPYPEKGEDKQHYISRCIPYIIKEKGVESDQAAAICYSLWSKNEDRRSTNIDVLIEKYIPIKHDGRNVEVYENPTILDLKSLKDNNVKELRFVIDMKNENLYIWSAIGALHHVIWNKLGLEPKIKEYGYEEHHEIVAGYGRIASNKIYVTSLLYDERHYTDVPDLSQYKLLKITSDAL